MADEEYCGCCCCGEWAREALSGRDAGRREEEGVPVYCCCWAGEL